MSIRAILTEHLLWRECSAKHSYKLVFLLVCPLQLQEASTVSTLLDRKGN